jgi:multidrug transporter EmrE-like cation transporter
MFAIISILFSSTSQLVLKKAVESLQDSPQLSSSFMLSILANPLVYMGVLMQVCALILWLYVLEGLDVSVAYPMISLGFVYVALVGIVVFGESFSSLSIFGLTLIVLGVSMLGLSSVGNVS